MNTTNTLLAILTLLTGVNTIHSVTKNTTTPTQTNTPIQCTLINPDRPHGVSSPQGVIDYYAKRLNDLNLTKDRVVHTTTLLGTALICYR